MKTALLVAALMLLIAAVSATALEKHAYQMKEDFGQQQLYDAALQYYYYIPCPTYAWFWAATGWDRGDMVGVWFQIGDASTGGWQPGDPVNCNTLEQIRILDMAGYGTVRPGLFTVEFEVFCSDPFGCPIGPALWNSGSRETHFGWNYYVVDPPISLCSCTANPGPPRSAPRVLVTATCTGTEGQYPGWGLDNVGRAVLTGCAMHDLGCLPALYPRPSVSHYTSIHSGYYGRDFEYCPPQWFDDGLNTTPGTPYGFIEIAWRIYITCSGPSDALPARWGDIKSIYR